MGPKYNIGPISIVPADEDDRDSEINLGEALGAELVPSHQVLRVYVPNCDRNGKEIGDQRRWVLAAAQLFSRIGGGVTVEPPVEGGWLDPDTQHIVWERPVLVYTYVNPDEFLAHLGELRQFLHRMGRETRQGEVALEFAGLFYRIRSYDQP
jgi:hypothetical protein